MALSARIVRTFWAASRVSNLSWEAVRPVKGLRVSPPKQEKLYVAQSCRNVDESGEGKGTLHVLDALSTRRRSASHWRLGI